MKEILVSLGAAFGGAVVGGVLYRLRMTATQGSLAEQGRRLAEEAKEERRRLIKEGEMSAKEELLRVQGRLDQEAKAQRSELGRSEQRLRDRETKLEARGESLEEREGKLRAKETAVQTAEKEARGALGEATERLRSAEGELERIGGLTRSEAREELVGEIAAAARAEAALQVREIEERAVEEAEQTAQRVIAGAVSRLAGGFVSEKTVRVVRLPGDEMKGRIIGREGRNIRAFENATGVDVVIDDTPEVVLLSAFSPLRRRVAQIALERLVEDGRIHPARIEEVVDAVNGEMDELLLADGEGAALELGLQGVHQELHRLLGQLKLRTLGGQNLLAHAIETASIAGALAAEIGADSVAARRAGLLHDIGRCVEHSMDGDHAEIGAEVARRHGERKAVVRAIREHHQRSPTTALGFILQAADLISRARPGARRDRIDGHLLRIEEMEGIATSFPGVMGACAIQAGTEVRVMVNCNKVSEGESLVLSREIADRIEGELPYPGEVRITVIREARASEIAT